MELADGHGQRVGRIGRRQLRKFQDSPDHRLDLPFFRPSVPDNRFFDLQGTVFEYRQAAVRPGQDRHAPNMTLFDQAADILPEKYILDRQGLRVRSAYHINDSITDGLKTCGKGGATEGLDLAVKKTRQAVCGFLDHPISRHMAARVDP